jgi:hypothetical protein
MGVGERCKRTRVTCECVVRSWGSSSMMFSKGEGRRQVYALRVLVRMFFGGNKFSFFRGRQVERGSF